MNEIASPEQPDLARRARENQARLTSALQSSYEISRHQRRRSACSSAKPLAGFAYDYLCDLVHPNKGSNLIILVDQECDAPKFNVDGQARLGFLIFDKVFPLVVRLCSDEFSKLFLGFAALAADEERIEAIEH